MPANPDHTIFPRAGFARRMGAYLYDFMAIIALLMLAALVALGFVALLIKLDVIVLGPDQDPASVMEGSLLYMAYLVAVTFWFFGGFWVRGGQTIGMRSWRIKVQNTDGSCISWKQAFIRFITAALGLSNFAVLFSKKRLGLQDRAADCEVIVLSAEANKLRNWRRLK